jgi:hypothetical protein
MSGLPAGCHGQSGLPQKRAIFGPWPLSGPIPNLRLIPSQGEEYAIFQGRDLASMQVCHNRPALTVRA